MSTERKYKIAIIGSGFAGIGMGIKLLEAGIDDFVILERANEAGGTWRDNTYPGAACDVSSHLYSFSFEPNPNWNRMFSGQAEILKYLKHCVKKYGLEKHISFNSNVTGGKYKEDLGIWEIGIENDLPVECRFLINGMGPLNRPSVPDFIGLESFKGDAFHSSEWDHNVDLKGKKVAVIGTGASAIQVVPSIATEVEGLYLFQRTPAWIMPKPDRKMGKIEKWLFNKIPFVQKAYRSFIYGVNELTAFALVYQPKLIKLIQKVSIRNMKRQVKDVTLQEKLTPKYSMGCKRILLSNNYYPALNRDNVKVVTESIESITEKGILTTNKEDFNVDVIVFCTGFVAAEYPEHFKFYGRDGFELSEQWKNGPEAYLGTTVNGFPNFYFIIGPNTGLGHNSMVFMIESQINYILDSIKKVSVKKAKSIEVKNEVQKAFNDKVQNKLRGTIWNSGCASWYLGKNGKNTTIWPGFTFEFWSQSRKIDDSDYNWY